MGESNSNGWDRWQKHVLAELARLQTCVDRIERSQRQLALDVAMLKVKSGVWGLIAGAIPVGILLLVQAWKN